MDRLSALPMDLQGPIWREWVCDATRRAYSARPFPRHALCSPPLFSEVAYLADALWTACYALTPPKEWLPLGEAQVNLKGMHPSASQTSNVLDWLDLNVEALPIDRVIRAVLGLPEDPSLDSVAQN